MIEPVLQAIVRDFNVRNAINYEISSTMIARLDEERRDTLIHLDGNHLMRLCIPITAMFVDNMLLGLGDVDHMNHPRCTCALEKKVPDERRAVGEDARSVRWYQQMRMSMQDGIFVQGNKGPLCSVNRGCSRRTQQRFLRLNREN